MEIERGTIIIPDPGVTEMAAQIPGTNPYNDLMPCQMCVIAPDDGAGEVSCAHYDTTEGPETLNPDWMSYLPDDMSLASLSIPGTNNSLAQYGEKRTQTWSIERQLNAGIRFLDVRVRVTRYGTIDVYNGPEYQQMNLSDVLAWVTSYLIDHPGEVILVRIRLDRETNLKKICGDKNLVKPARDEDRQLQIETLADENQNLFEALNDLMGAQGEFGAFYYRVSDPNITLGQARGKFIIVQDYEGPMDALSFEDSFQVLKSHCFESLEKSEIKKKKKLISEHMKKAGKSTKDYRYFLTYTTGLGYGFRPFRVAFHMNAQALGFLHKHASDVTKVGILAMDFPGQVLICAIIHKNFANKRKWNKKKARFVFE